MRISLASFLMISCLSASAQVVIVNSEHATALYEAYQLTDSTDETDKWQITVSLKNSTVGDLYYNREPGNLDNANTIPYYLKVEVPNAIMFRIAAKDVAATLMIATSGPQPNNDVLPNTVFFYGTGTMIMHSNHTNIFRIKPIRIEKTFIVTVPQGDRPTINGEFARTLLPLEKMDLLRKKRK